MFSWFLDKKLVMTSFRRLEAGQPVCLVEQKADPAPGPAPSPASLAHWSPWRCRVVTPAEESLLVTGVGCLAVSGM